MTDYKRVEYDNTPVLVARADTQDRSALAQQATKLANARSIKTDLGSASQASFDGSADVTPGVSGVLPVANGGTGSNVQNFVGLTGNQTVGGVKTYSDQQIYKNARNLINIDTKPSTYTSQTQIAYPWFISVLNSADNMDVISSSQIRRTPGANAYTRQQFALGNLSDLDATTFGYLRIYVRDAGTVDLYLAKQYNGSTTETLIATI